MKYLLLVFSCLLCLFWGCSKSVHSAPAWFEDNGKIKVLSTTAMIDDLVGEIGGDRVDHIPLMMGEIDPHSYELVKGDDEKMTFAQIMVANGLNLEHGASLRHQLAVHPCTINVGDEILRRVPDRILTVDGTLDPHVWMDISLWCEGIDAIVAGLISVDPENALFYKRNGDLLRQKMLIAHRGIQKDLAEVPEERRYLVTSHDAFHYFTRAYLAQGASEENRCVAPEGLAPEGQLSSTDIQRVIDHLCAYEVRVVFPESNVSRDALKKIVSSCGHKVRICSSSLYGDAMGSAGSGAETYLGMIQHNARVLKKEWEK